MKLNLDGLCAGNRRFSLYSSAVNYTQFLTPILQFSALRLRTYVNAYSSSTFSTVSIVRSITKPLCQRTDFHSIDCTNNFPIAYFHLQIIKPPGFYNHLSKHKINLLHKNHD